MLESVQTPRTVVNSQLAEKLPEDAEEQALQTVGEQSSAETAAEQAQKTLGGNDLLCGSDWSSVTTDRGTKARA